MNSLNCMILDQRFRLYSMQNRETLACRNIAVFVQGSRKVKCPSLVFEAMPALPK